MWKYLLGLLASITVVVLLYRSFYRLDGFDSDPLAGTTPCDPSCTGFGHSNVSGRPCCHDAVGQVNPTSQADCPSGTTFDTTAKQCLVCTMLPNGTSQCHSAGSYDAGKPDPKYNGSIDKDTVKTDVLTDAATTHYSDWVNDSSTSSDIRGSGGGKLYGTYSESKNNSMSIQDLINSKMQSDTNNSKIYNRYMERPSDMSYDDDVEYEDEDEDDDDEAEGFASRL